MSVTAVWAQSLDGIIGNGENMPWEIREDLTHFKQVTTVSHGYENIIIMGRKTWESIGSKPLPGRKNIILSTKPMGEWSHGALVINDDASMEALINSFDLFGLNVFIIGGGEIYEKFLPLIDRFEITVINKELSHILGDNAVKVPEVITREHVDNNEQWLPVNNAKIMNKNGVLEKDDTLKIKFISIIGDK